MEQITQSENLMPAGYYLTEAEYDISSPDAKRGCNMQIRAKINGRFEEVEVTKKVNLGLRVTHNRDGRFTKVWALACDGRVFRTSSYGSCYKPAQPGETAPKELFS